MKTYTYIDRAGVGLSTLCIVHCLLLPILASSLPILGLLSEFEWIHKGLVMIALPVALSLIATTKRFGIQILAAFGAIMLFGAAFIHQFHDFETVMTICGGLFLGLAHIIRQATQRHAH